VSDRPSVPIVYVNSSVTLDPMEQNVEADAGSAALTLTLPPFQNWVGLTISITKVDASANAVSWVATGDDAVVGLGTSGSLGSQGQQILITATNG